ncbi:transcriptional regulator [Vibrio phage 381E49-1]|nr:transcriptional regulator [Vibrio phage 381E49-1]
MSMMLMVKAMQTKVGNPLRKLVLIKLADNANDQGECWPSHQHVADQCEISKTSVRNHIKKLQEMGLLKVEHREGPKGNTSNLYHLSLQGMAGNGTGMAGNGIGGIAGDGTRTSHSFEPVKEPYAATPPKEKKASLDYDRIKEIFNETLTKASNIVKLTEKRKKLVKKLFDDFELDYEKFVSYLTFLNEHPDAQWMFERRIKTDGSGQYWNAQTFEYFVSEKCFLNAKENMQ